MADTQLAPKTGQLTLSILEITPGTGMITGASSLSNDVVP
jgi:hypothetical protein